jgi:two-component system LytT family response regulator
MLNTVIIEDEKPAYENLVSSLADIANDVQVITRLATVKESINYLSAHPSIDLIFCDVQLGDGLSFEIFNHVAVHTPVIFITCYEDFLMNAFEHNGIDYLLKPVDKAELNKSLSKYRMLERHFSAQQSYANLSRFVRDHKKQRLIVRKGTEHIALRLEEIVLFYTENKVVYALDNDGKKYLADHNLSELELTLDTASFFRANRQYIININYIRSFKTYEKVKVQIDLTIPELNHYIIVSQEMAPQFREWMHNA